jgi:DNA-binding transcriptional ArsR family regulator
MKASLVENRGDVKVSYESLVVAPRKLSVFNSDLALRIVNDLVKNPGCAMDLSRNLGEHEQKIYYHLRKLENVGVVKPVGTEKRYGMIAKIYAMSCPVIATKLYEDGHPLEKTSSVKDPNIAKFLHPFIEDGELNAKIIIGDPYSHGRFDKASHEGPYALDFAIFLGNYLNQIKFPHYKLDTEVNNNDLKDNLILIGNMKSNVVIDKVNKELPIHFDTKDDFRIVSTLTKNSYKDPRVGVVIKTDNPFIKGKKILILGGIGSRGTRSSIIAFTQYFQELVKNNEENDKVFRVVKGFDKSGDRIIDSVEIME